MVATTRIRLLWVLQDLKRDGAEVVLRRRLHEVILVCWVIGYHFTNLGSALLRDLAVERDPR